MSFCGFRSVWVLVDSIGFHGFRLMANPVALRPRRKGLGYFKCRYLCCSVRININYSDNKLFFIEKSTKKKLPVLPECQ